MKTGRTSLLYDYVLAPVYDRLQRHMVVLKQESVRFTTLKPGGSALVLCCGTGLEIPFILEKVGQGGRIVAVDQSEGMLNRLRRKQQKDGWNNLTAIQGDATSFELGDYGLEQFDAAFCTLGLSLIPEYDKALDTLIRSVKEGGEVIVADTKLRGGRFPCFTTLSAWASLGCLEATIDGTRIATK